MNNHLRLRWIILFSIITTAALIGLGFVIGMNAHPYFELKCTTRLTGPIENDITLVCERAK